jgi:hypothetical protein
MKFRSLCVALTAVIGLWSSASALDLGLGVKGGLNLSSTYGVDYQEDKGLLPGPVIGAGLQLKLANVFAIQPEVLFSSKGIKLKKDDVTTRTSLRYLEIPVLFQVLIPASDIVVPQFYAGPAIAFKTGFDIKAEYRGKEDVPSSIIDEKEEALKSVDFGIAMGAGLGFKAGIGRIILDVRYTLGLTGLQDIPDEVEEVADALGVSINKEKNMALSFMLGYMFEF